MNATIEINDKEMNKRIERAISRIPSKPTVTKVMGLFIVDKPSQEYLKAYLKRWY